MKNKKLIVTLVIFLIAVLVGVYLLYSPLFYWYDHDTLTGMQLFKKYWKHILSGYLILITIKTLGGKYEY